MASLSPQASQRRPSLPGRSISATASDREVAQDAVQAANDSETAENGISQSQVTALPVRSASDAAAAAEATTPKPEPRHCWICLQDEDEDGSDNSAWRSPCPCNLQAHEECMLEWIADLEAPRSRRGRPPQKVLCPQCKAEIRIERPRDVIVSIVDLLNATGRAFLLPAGFGALCGCVFSGSLVYGLNSLYLVFGSDYADDLLRRPSKEVSIVRKLIGSRSYGFMLKLTDLSAPFVPTSDRLSLGMYMGLPTVGPALILSRTRLFDYFFSIAPLPFFAVPLLFSSEDRIVRRWPPSPDLVIAILPYIRAAYNEIYRITFAELEKKWDQTMQRKTKEGEAVDQAVQDQNEQDGDGEGVMDLPIRAELELVMDLGVLDQAVPQEIVEAQPAEPIPVQEGQNEAQHDANAEAVQQPNDAPGPNAEEQLRQVAGRDIYPLDIASTIMGALFFPTISSLMGDLLKHTLPKKWVMRSVLSISAKKTKTLPATGLLQEKWGRSIIGGCLFVVLKDALVLYVKWKRAKNQGKRKVLDFVGKK